MDKLEIALARFAKPEKAVAESDAPQRDETGQVRESICATQHKPA